MSERTKLELAWMVEQIKLELEDIEENLDEMDSVQLVHDKHKVRHALGILSNMSGREIQREMNELLSEREMEKTNGD